MIKIAMLYDVDETLVTKCMQEFELIPKLGYTSDEFWREKNKHAEETGMEAVMAYMYWVLKLIKEKGLSLKRQDFVNYGKALEFFPGVTEWFDRINEFGKQHGAEIEHYIISSGQKEFVEGCSIAKHFKKVFACEYHYDENGNADFPLVAVNYSGKVQFLFRINKQVLSINNDKDVNDRRTDRAIPFSRMIYFGDGFTDVPCMKLINEKGGFSVGVFGTSESICKELIKQDRVNCYFRADYTEDSELDKTIKKVIRKMVIESELEELRKSQIAKVNADIEGIII